LFNFQGSFSALLGTPSAPSLKGARLYYHNCFTLSTLFFKFFKLFLIFFLFNFSTQYIGVYMAFTPQSYIKKQAKFACFLKIILKS